MIGLILRYEKMYPQKNYYSVQEDLIIAKFLYLQSIENNIQTDWYKELYLSTISAFNNFHEFNSEEEKLENNRSSIAS